MYVTETKAKCKKKYTKITLTTIVGIMFFSPVARHMPNPVTTKCCCPAANKDKNFNLIHNPNDVVICAVICDRCYNV